MTEGAVISVDFGSGMAVPLKLLERVSVWGVPHWTCLMDSTPILISEERLKLLRLYYSKDYEPLE